MIGYESFDRIRETKEDSKRAIRELTDQVAVLIYAAVAKGWGFAQLRKKYAKLIKESPFTGTKVSQALDKAAHGAYNRSRSPESAVRVLDDEKTFKGVRKASLRYLDEVEATEKDEVLKQALDEPKEDGKVREYKAFMLCSRHDDCAEDHEKYQGKVYVKSWALRYEAIRDYCTAKGIRTVEWVTNRPVWMTTRPNCRHFFKEFSLAELEATPINVLLDEFGMNRPLGTTPHANIKHSTRKDWYTKENVDRIIIKYQERKAKHEKMAKVYENENLRNLIKHDGEMIRKWKSYRKTLK